MLTYTTNLIIYTGTDFNQTFILEDSDSNSLKNLSGYTGYAKFKKYETSKTSYSFSITFFGDRSNGKIMVSMSASSTSTLKPGKYFYDVVLTDSQGINNRVVEGEVIVKKSVTR